MGNLSIAAGSGDGWMENTAVNFSAARNDTIATSLSDTDYGRYVKNQSEADGDYLIGRCFYPFNTSIGSKTSIQSATLKLSISDFDLPADEAICICEGWPNATANLTHTDWDNVGDIIGGEISNASLTQYDDNTTIALNSIGISWINKTGYTTLVYRFKGDINDSGQPGNNYLYTYFTESALHDPPILNINYAGYPEATTFNLTQTLAGYVSVNEMYTENGTLNLTSSVSGEFLRTLEGTLNLTASIEGQDAWIISSTLNLTSQLSSQFKYDLEYQLNLTSNIASYEEATYIIPDELLPTPPKFKLLGYRVIQEFGTPYYVAEVKFQGTDIPSKDEYIQITQTDAETSQVKTIFRGFPISVKWKLKKDLVEATVTAVTNGWYLTQQCPPKVYCSCPQYQIGHWDDLNYYPRMNEVMLLWDWLNFIPNRATDYAYYGSRDLWIRTRGFNSWYTKWSGKKVATKWSDMCGVAPSYELADEISDLVNTYMPCADPNEYEASACYTPIPDARGNTDGPLPGTFNDMTESKWDAIMKMADWSDHVVHTRIAQNDANLTRRQPPYGCYDKGTLVLYWTNATLANATDQLEPFNVLLNIDAITDNTFIEAITDERKTDRSIPNLVEIRSQEQDEFALNTSYSYGYYPCYWWQRATGDIACGAYWWEHQKPVMHYKTQPELDQAGVDAYAEEFYNRLREGENKYSGTFLSSVCERTSPYRCVLPGSRIQITNVSGHNDSEMRITKIIHSKDGAKASMTQIEYCTVYDLAHPNIKESGIMDKILADFERKAIRGTREETYQNVYNPRKRGIGSPVYAEVGIVENVSSDLNLADVRLVNTSSLLKDVIAF